MILAVAVTNVHFVAFCVQTYVLASREGKMTGIILFYFLVDFLLKLYQLLLDFVVDVPLICQEIVRVVFFSLLWIVDIFALLPNMVNCALDHAVGGNV